VTLRVNPLGLAAGTYTATVTLSSANAGTAAIAVTLTVTPSFAVTYGTVDQISNQKVLLLDPGESFRPSTTVRDNAGNVVGLPVVYQSRSPSLATVAADGTISARGEGHLWVIARVNSAGGLTDSVFVNVTRGAGPVLKTDVSRFIHDRGATFSVIVQLDTRGAAVSAMQVIFTWPSVNDNPGMLRLVGVAQGPVGNVQYTNDPNYGTTRLTLVSATPLTGVITLARFDFSAVVVGTSQFGTRLVELLAPDQSSLLGMASALSYPVIVR